MPSARSLRRAGGWFGLRDLELNFRIHEVAHSLDKRVALTSADAVPTSAPAPQLLIDEDVRLDVVPALPPLDSVQLDRAELDEPVEGGEMVGRGAAGAIRPSVPVGRGEEAVPAYQRVVPIGRGALLYRGASDRPEPRRGRGVPAGITERHLSRLFASTAASSPGASSPAASTSRSVLSAPRAPLTYLA